ncbi:3-dehydrosphinganine reductase [Orbilia oligospora]|uniref:3-dehydrosphinganine reductase n=1 Tax=Orbilia oligospora TaxID=2813651 RepID=A0A7C8QGJ5_ORBOL|nr:3-dehydrosphinganine reductase [Orbilia oligospora]
MSLPGSPIVIGLTTVAALIVTTSLTMGFFAKNQMPVAGRNIIITGASQGMGKAVAILLASLGANVAIVARDLTKLAAAAAEIQAVIDANASKYPDQKLAVISADLSEVEGAQRAVAEAEAQIGETEILWCCAGGANPGFFRDYKPADLEWAMKTNYWSAVYIAHNVIQLMTSRPPPTQKYPTNGNHQRKIIFTSSLVAFCPLVGYSSYSGPKAALRALTDTLRQECLLYDIDVHCCCPGSILSPGLENENLTKPGILKEIEAEDDTPQTSEDVAKYCLEELQRGQTLPVSSFLARAARSAMVGPTPRVGFLFETLLSWACAIVYIFVRRGHDGIVLRERKAKGLPWENKQV